MLESRPRPNPGDNEDETMDVLKHHFHGGKREYLVRWRGCSKTTWEPEENMVHAQESIQMYWSIVKQRLGSQRKHDKEQVCDDTRMVDVDGNNDGDEHDEDQEWEVESVVGHRTRNGEREYEVGWSAFSETSWEPEAYLVEAQQAVQEYWSKQQESK